MALRDGVNSILTSTSDAPDHWHRAIAVREALIASKLAARQTHDYDYDRAKVRTLRDAKTGRRKKR